MYPAGERLAVAEGIETALAVHELTGWPAWATISAGGMKMLELPENVGEVRVCGDHDPAGVEAAHVLALELWAADNRQRQNGIWLDVACQAVGLDIDSLPEATNG